MEILGYELRNPFKKTEGLVIKKTIEPLVQGKKEKKTVSVPAGRVSVPEASKNGDFISGMDNKLQFVKPDFATKCIPLIRKLYKVNEDVGSVLYDAIQLTNTGHKIKVDQSVPPDLQDEMRAHLKKVSKNWHTGTASIDGLVNKWIAQVYVAGALSVEWAPKMDLSGIDQSILVNPESILFSLDKGKYHPYQKVKGLRAIKDDKIKLNTNTYLYYGLYSDEDTPYGIPPFLAALSAIDTQGDMKKNINHILKQLGLLGYLEVKLDKPDQQANETESAYKSRIELLLTETKKNVLAGFMDGVVVGYQDDHQFEFHSTTKQLAGVNELFNMNENQIANGLKTSPSFLGVSSGSTESFLSIVFTKTLSQLKNVQQVLARALEKGYELELALAGYNYKSIHVEFNPSTVTDDLKLQQGREIKQRVLKNLWIDGIISQETYADEMNYQKPAKKMAAPKPEAKDSSKTNPEAKEKRKDDKNKSARRSRDKAKEQPKRKDNNTKPQ